GWSGICPIPTRSRWRAYGRYETTFGREWLSSSGASASGAGRLLARRDGCGRHVPSDLGSSLPGVSVGTSRGHDRRNGSRDATGPERLIRGCNSGAGEKSALRECEEGDLNPHGFYPTSPSN